MTGYTCVARDNSGDNACLHYPKTEIRERVNLAFVNAGSMNQVTWHADCAKAAGVDYVAATLTTEIVYAVYIDAGTDRNGNPRRGWLLYDKAGDFRLFVEEGYRGRGALKSATAGVDFVIELGGAIPTTAKFYRECANG